VMRLPFVKRVNLWMLAMWRRKDQEIGLKQAVSQNAQTLKHGAAKNSRVDQRCTGNIFNDVGFAGSNQHFAHWLNQARPFVAVLVSLGQIGISLTRRRGVNGVKRFKKLHVELQGIGLNEFKRKVWLWGNVHADNFKSSPAVSDGNPTGA